jgi:hypothetical protein
MKKQLRNLIPQTLSACVLASAATSQAFLDDSSFYIVVPTIGYHMTDEIDTVEKAVKDMKKEGVAGAKADFDDDVIYGISFGFQFNGTRACL